MFFDQQEYYCATGMFAFSDFPFGDLPVQPDNVGEKFQVQGCTPSNGGRQLNIGGTADQYGPLY